MLIAKGFGSHLYNSQNNEFSFQGDGISLAGFSVP